MLIRVEIEKQIPLCKSPAVKIKKEIEKMRIIAFTMTLFLGVYVASFFYTAPSSVPCNNLTVYSNGFGVASGAGIKAAPIKFDTSQNYSLNEANALIGKPVRNLSGGNAKCPKDAGNCLNLFMGEMGKVVSILPSLENTYLIEIQWEESPEDYKPRYSGRMTTSANGEVSFEQEFKQPKGAFVTRAGKEVSFEIVQ